MPGLLLHQVQGLINGLTARYADIIDAFGKMANV